MLLMTIEGIIDTIMSSYSTHTIVDAQTEVALLCNV
jgi:hypothetical protein